MPPNLWVSQGVYPLDRMPCRLPSSLDRRVRRAITSATSQTFHDYRSNEYLDRIIWADKACLVSKCGGIIGHQLRLAMGGSSSPVSLAAGLVRTPGLATANTPRASAYATRLRHPLADWCRLLVRAAVWTDVSTLGQLFRRDSAVHRLAA